MVALTGSERSLTFHIVVFENIHPAIRTLLLISPRERLSNDASFLEYEGFSFAAKLIVRVLTLPFDRFDGATTLGTRGFSRV